MTAKALALRLNVLVRTAQFHLRRLKITMAWFEGAPTVVGSAPNEVWTKWLGKSAWPAKENNSASAMTGSERNTGATCRRSLESFRPPEAGRFGHYEFPEY